MKKLMALIMVPLVCLSIMTTAFAAGTISLGSDSFTPTVNGRYKVVEKTVKTKKETYKITGYYFADQSKEVFRLMNIERADRGLPKLLWEDDLVQPAIQRALEQYVLKSHKRPDGRANYTVSGLVNGENIAGGDIDAADVMYGWMDSREHKANILDKDYTSVAVACVETDEMCFWVQLFHSDKKVSASDPNAKPQSSAASDSTQNSASKVTAKSIVADLNKAKTTAKTTSVTLKNVDSVTPEVLKAMSDWGRSNNKTVSLTANTLGSTGKTVQGQMVLSPALFTGIKSDLKLGVRADEASVSGILFKFNKWYKNKVAVIKLEQTGNLSAAVNIAVKVDLTGIGTQNLVFYSYDSSSNKIYKLPLKKGEYFIDKNKYLHFTTSKGSYIIITDKDLAK